MIVVSVISILSVIGIGLINQRKQIDRANDAVNKSSLEKIIQGIESYYYAEGKYPTANTDGSDPLANNPDLKVYIQSWPTGFYYRYDSATNDFAVIVKENANNYYYKYHSLGAQIVECNNGSDDVWKTVTACN